MNLPLLAVIQFPEQTSEIPFCFCCIGRFAEEANPGKDRFPAQCAEESSGAIEVREDHPINGTLLRRSRCRSRDPSYQG